MNKVFTTRRRAVLLCVLFFLTIRHQLLNTEMENNTLTSAEPSFKILKEVKYQTMRLLLTEREGLFYVITAFDEDEDSPDCQDIVVFNELIEAAIYFGRLDGQCIATENF